jgi:hypothetical protein
MNTITSLSKQTKYLKWYISLTSKEYDNNIYTEKHHILPKSLGGTNAKSNIVQVPARIHFICHKLLVKMVIDARHKKCMCHALNMLAKANNCNQNRYRISSREYEFIRKQLSESMKGENNHMHGKPAWNKGIKRSEETKAKISAANKDYYKTRPGTRQGAITSEATKMKQRGPKSETHKQHLSIAAKTKPRHQCEYCAAYIIKSNYTRWHGNNCKHKPE